MVNSKGSRSRHVELRLCRRAAALALLVAALAAPLTVVTRAAAQTEPPGKALFNEGRALMARGMYAEACLRFEESQRIEERTSTGYMLALCYAKTARTAAAWSLFTKVAEAAALEALSAGPTRKAAKKRLAEQAQKKADALDPTLAKICVILDPDAARIQDLEVRLDEELIPASRIGQCIAVDLGDHVVRASAAGRQTSVRHERARTAGRLEIIVYDLDRSPEAAPAPQPKPIAPAPQPKPTPIAPPPQIKDVARTDHTVTVALATVGFIGLAVGTVAGLQAISLFKHSKATCPSGCFEGSSKLAQAMDDVDNAQIAAAISTGGFIAGGGAAAGAVIRALLVRSKSAEAGPSVALFPAVGPRSAGFLLDASF